MMLTRLLIRTVFVVVVWASFAGKACAQPLESKSKPTVFVESGGLKYQIPSKDYALNDLMPERVILADISFVENVGDWVKSNRKQYPNLRTVILGNDYFDDKWVESLKELPKLRLVVLDSIPLTNQEYGEICIKHEDLAFLRSQRKTIDVLDRNGVMFKLEIDDTCIHPELGNVHLKRIVTIERMVFPSGTIPPPLNTESRAELPSIWSLRYLDLSDTLIGNHEFKNCVSVCKNHIEVIKAPYTKLSRFDWEDFRGEKVRLIDFSNSHFDGVLSVFPNLEIANLANTQFSSESCKSLKGLEKLKNLNVANTQIDEQGIQAIAQLKALEYLALDVSFQKSKSLESLLNKNPKVTIVFSDGTTANKIRKGN